MSSTTNKRPEPCGHENCGSRRFHLGNDGFTYCSRGHQQSERGTIVSEDPGEYTLAGRKARRKDSDDESTKSRASGYKGPRAFEHYLLCLQLILRKQLRWLIEFRKLPTELEALVYDLWALKLQSSRNGVSYDSDTETDTQSQYFSSQSEGETAASEASAHSRKRSRTSVVGAPGMLDTLAICYIGTLLLREPVTIAAIHQWASSGDLLYYHASKQVPLSMRERLPPKYQELLEVKAMGKAEKLQKHVLDMLITFDTDIGMAFPPINQPIILNNWVRALALPLEVFAGTSRLARALDMTFEYKLDSKPGARDAIRLYPEPRLIAVLVVATKLLFPFDDIERSPASATAMDTMALNWSNWASAVTHRHSADSLEYADALDFSQADVLGAAEQQLDQYMDWCEQNIASEDVRERGSAGRDADFRRILFRMFPAHQDAIVQQDHGSDQAAQADVETERLRKIQGTCTAKEMLAELPARDVAKASGMGSFYRRTKSTEELEGPCLLFFEQAARSAGLSIDGMVKAVSMVERKMQVSEERLRKEDVG